ncbi:hypothetical protein [Mesorhizobium sp. IMUNJ 23232]|uniref:hypothetical protein n=1 Tax=Mesorhizobium sp. IMUNJ 23232 TaxID=3376064 RepID=UPI0037BA2FA5
MPAETKSALDHIRATPIDHLMMAIQFDQSAATGAGDMRPACNPRVVIASYRGFSVGAFLNRLNLLRRARSAIAQTGLERYKTAHSLPGRITGGYGSS